MWMRAGAATYVQIIATERWTSRHQLVHNLSVADAHTYYVLAGDMPLLVHNDGTDDFSRARNKALAWLEQRGFKAEKPTIGKFGYSQGKPIGMQTTDGKTGFRDRV